MRTPRTLRVETAAGQQFITFGKAIVAVGSRPAMPAAFDLGNPRVMTSTEALEIEEIPEKLLVVGGGYIGMELGTVYATLGSEVIVVEALPAGARRSRSGSRAAGAAPCGEVVQGDPHLGEGAEDGHRGQADQGGHRDERREASGDVRPRAGVRGPRAELCATWGSRTRRSSRTRRGYIKVDKHQQTADPNILAIGDVVGGVMLAHKASKEARIAVEAIAG